jgi:hypothetical protein
MWAREDPRKLAHDDSKVYGAFSTTNKMSGESKVVRNESFDSLGGVEFLMDELNSQRLGAESPKPKVTEFRKKELRGEIYEPLLAEDKHRFVLFPIKHDDVRTILSLFLLYCRVPPLCCSQTNDHGCL